MEKDRIQRFELPWPPTVNKAWRMNKGRMTQSKQAVAYKRSISGYLLAAGYKPFGTARLGLFILARPPDNRARDLDNLFKVLLDSLQRAALFDDDSQIDDLQIVRGTRVQGGAIELQIWEQDDISMHIHKYP